jgi:cholest-4-en-3-one 26-monooxygenase
MAVVDQPVLDVDLTKERFAQGVPFETFAELRRKAPLYWHEPDQGWIVTSYELLGTINRDPERFSSHAGPGPAGSTSLGSERGLTILTMDPPEHTRYRRLVSMDFTPRAIAAWEPLVRELAQECIREFVEAGGGDFVKGVAALLPMRVICAMMGIGRSDEAELIALSNATILSADPEYAPTPDTPVAANVRFGEYASELLEAHRRNPKGDLVDRLLDARVDGQPMSQAELQAWVTMYITGGAETTRQLLSNGLLTLFDWPGAVAQLQGGADVGLAVEEMLRFTTPVMGHARWPLEDVTFGDLTIREGERTTLWMISANRDEAAFDDPDVFDITRNPNRHDSLGAGGPHFCLGAGLARLEARVVFEELMPWLDEIAPDGPHDRAQHTMFNAIKRLPVTIG